MPYIHPTLLVLALVFFGLASILIAALVPMPAEWRAGVAGTGLFLLGWAKQRPGDTRRDDYPNGDDLRG